MMSTIEPQVKEARNKRPHFMLLFLWNVQNKQTQRQKITTGCQGMEGGKVRTVGVVGILCEVMEIL